MADDKKQPGSEFEPKVETLEKRHEGQKPESKEVHEAKSEVGAEAGEIIEGAEIPSGKISESEKKKKEGDSGGTAGKATTQSTKIEEEKLPSVKRMSSQVENELKKEIKDLHKKIKSVMKKNGAVDAAQLNTLMARLRQLKEVLASIAYATADAIKEMWYKYVQK